MYTSRSGYGSMITVRVIINEIVGNGVQVGNLVFDEHYRNVSSLRERFNGYR